MKLVINIRNQTITDAIEEAVRDFFVSYDDDVIEEFLVQAAVSSLEDFAERLINDEGFMVDYRSRISKDLEMGYDLDYALAIPYDEDFFVKKIKPYVDACKSVVQEKNEREIKKAIALLRDHGYTVS